MPKSPKWNESPCPYCKEPIAPDASRCPHCQSDFTPAQVEARKKEQRGAVMFGCGTLLALVLLIGWCSMPKQVADKPDASAKADAVTVLRGVAKAVRPCDQASSRIASAASSGDRMVTFRAAQEAEGQCLGVGAELNRITVPETLGKAGFDAMTAALDTCQNGYASRWDYVKSLREAVGGDVDTAAVARIEDSAETAQSGVIMCVGMLSDAARKAGVEDSEFAAAFQ